MIRVVNLVIFVMMAYPASISAETLYVADLLRITIRTGPSTDNKILEQVQSGDALEVLEPEADGWTRVRSEKGTEGYAMSRFLMTEKIARDKLVVAEARLAELTESPNSLQSRLVSTQQENIALKAQNDELSREVQQMAVKMADINETAADAMAISQERDDLVAERNQLLIDLDTARIDNRVLEDQSDKKWFLVGAGILFLGIILGLVLPGVRSKRRSSWSSGSF